MSSKRDQDLAALYVRLEKAVTALDRLEASWGQGSRKERTAYWLDVFLPRFVSPRATAERRREWLLQEVAEVTDLINQMNSNSE